MGQGTKISVAVVTEIAEREGVDPTELTPPLYEVVDPDALDTLFHRTGTESPVSRVEFSYRGYDVVADSTGDVRVQGSTTTAPPSESTATD